MRKRSLLYLIAAASSLAGVVQGQHATPPPAPAATAPTPPKSPFTQGGMDFSFMFDGYVNGSYNHPDSGFNQLRNFDFRADTLHVNMGKITIDRAPAPVGFHLDVGFGHACSVIHSTDRAPEAL